MPNIVSEQLQLIKQGAEAKVYKTAFLLPDLPCLLKVRPKKRYRHPVLDQRLTRHRCLSEARLLNRCRGLGVPCPSLYFVDEGRGEIFMEWIEGSSVRDVLDTMLHAAEDSGRGNDDTGGDSGIKVLMTQIGEVVGKLHQVNVVHGDLTTSNLMLRNLPQSSSQPQLNSAITDVRQLHTDLPSKKSQFSSNFEIVLIDFGLGSVSTSEEDKAVDIYVLERAFISTHPKAEAMFQVALDSYAKSYADSKIVLNRLREVRLRGRKRSMVG